MKVLWFTNTPSNYTNSSNIYNGGGWISSLEKEFKQRKEIELAICFLFNEEKKVLKDGVIYYPIKPIKSYKYSQFFKRKYHIQDDISLIHKFLDIIDDFKPDIIHIFGSEMQFGLISKFTKIPIVLHIQGILAPCLNAYLPPFISWTSLYWGNTNPLHILRRIKEKIFWEYSVNREKEIIENIYNYIGRTTWDKRVIKTLNPQCKYYIGNEILRETFYNPLPRIIPQQLTIVSTISNSFYKGLDLILKTAVLLKRNFKLKFRWIVYGNINPSLIEKLTKISHKEVYIEFKGVASADEIKKAISSCTLYMHPSYIDNSPNSLCEAQILGCPVIATNIGGIPSLVKEGKTGFLIPANDPYQAAYLINELYHDEKSNIEIGNNAQKEANIRHNTTTIINELIKTYQDIIVSNN